MYVVIINIVCSYVTVWLYIKYEKVFYYLWDQKHETLCYKKIK